MKECKILLFFAILQAKGDPVVEDVWSRVNSLVKYQFALVDARATTTTGDDDTERFLLLVDASQDSGDGGTGNRGGYKAVSLLLSNLVSWKHTKF